ncbi:MAG: hypothetical protein Q4B43_02180 [Bacteroidota bacterium]|nr:hypothetical protein [Bacteroidota bacterium]
MIFVNSINALKSTNINENIVFVTGYYTIDDGGGGIFMWINNINTPDNGGTIIKSNQSHTGRWQRINNSTSVNVLWFGAKPDCRKHTNFNDNLNTATDNSVSFQKAINYCQDHGFDLYIPSGKHFEENYYFQYLISDTLHISKPLNIIGASNASIIGSMLNKPIINISNCVRGKIENLIICGFKYRPSSGILFSPPDNQCFEMNNIKIFGCKYGVYCITPETINRIVISKCDFSSNIRTGFYLNSSYHQNNIGHNTPITFIHTIMNANGFHPWMQHYNLDNPSDGEFYQLYINGAHNVSYISGQISNHGSTSGCFNKSLIYISNGAGANFSGVDIEDVSNTATAAFYANNFKDINILQSHIWRINSPNVFYLEGACGYVSIKNVNLDNDKFLQLGSFKYAVELTNSNFYNDIPISIPNNIKSTHNYQITFLEFFGPIHKLSDNALRALDKSNMKILTNIVGGIHPNKTQNQIWNNYYVSSNKYILSNNSNNAMFIEKEIKNASLIFCVIECTQDSFEGSGKFYIKQLNNNHIIEEKTLSTKGILKIANRYFNFISLKINADTNKIRYGFYNSNPFINNASIPEHATVKGLIVYSSFHNPISKDSDVDFIF